MEQADGQLVMVGIVGDDTLQKPSLYSAGGESSESDSTGLDDDMGAAPSPIQRFGLARYDPQGQLDPSFGVGGRVTSALTEENMDLPFVVAIQRDGRIVAAGSVLNSEAYTQDFALVRYLGGGTPVRR